MEKKLILPILLLIIIPAVSFLYYQSQAMKRTYKAEVMKGLSQFDSGGNQIITEEDIRHLPEPVQKYLRYVGVIGREKVQNFRTVFEGEMKGDPEKGWMKISSEQYNFFKHPTREFYINGKMFGLPVLGLHSYSDEKVYMLIKVAGLLTVSDVGGREMELGETVTVFNDMCLMAPATLIDKKIEWETIDPLQVKATFDNKGRKISATLYFNDLGELTNFVSDDRYMTKGKELQKWRWSTPVKDYRDFNGFRLASYGEAIWSLPEGDYTYARFWFKEIEYNRRS